MKTKRIIRICLLCVLVFGVLSSVTTYAAKQFFSIAANPIGQTAYQWAAGISDIINKNLPEITATAEETKGYLENVRLLINGSVEAGFSNNILLHDAYYGEGMFSEVKPRQVMGVMAISPIVMHVMTLEGSPVKSVYDFKGRRVGMGQPGGSSLIDATRLIEALGYKESDFRAYKVNLSEQIDMLRNGQLDVAIWNGSIPLPAVIELATTKKVNFLPIPDEVSAKIISEFPAYYEADLPANIYPGLEKPVNSFALQNVLMVRSDLQEETVYSITKLIMENLAHLKKVHPAFGWISEESVLTGFTVPVHPGALRYYRETKIPGIEDFAKKFN